MGKQKVLESQQSTMHNHKFSMRLREQKGIDRRKEKNKAKRERQHERAEMRKQLGDAAPPKQEPKTIENTREYDVTMVDPVDEEVLEDEAGDEMASYFDRETAPKVAITASPFAKKAVYEFAEELSRCIPNSTVYKRRHAYFKKMVEDSKAEGVTDIVVVHDDRKQPSALTICHLPNGPTARFKIMSFVGSDRLKHHGWSEKLHPEVILNNFNTRLGHTIGRMFACLFPFNPRFTGRRVVTFHNQRDYIFFRHHRYEFKKNGEKAALLELGPRFTLRLKTLQKGTFDTKHGEYEWVLKRHEMETSRRKFFL